MHIRRLKASEKIGKVLFMTSLICTVIIMYVLKYDELKSVYCWWKLYVFILYNY